MPYRLSPHRLLWYCFLRPRPPGLSPLRFLTVPSAAFPVPFLPILNPPGQTVWCSCLPLLSSYHFLPQPHPALLHFHRHYTPELWPNPEPADFPRPGSSEVPVPEWHCHKQTGPVPFSALHSPLPADAAFLLPLPLLQLPVPVPAAVHALFLPLLPAAPGLNSAATRRRLSHKLPLLHCNPPTLLHNYPLKAVHPAVRSRRPPLWLEAVP